MIDNADSLWTHVKHLQTDLRTDSYRTSNALDKTMKCLVNAEEHYNMLYDPLNNRQEVCLILGHK